jgi:hypothetical protein
VAVPNFADFQTGLYFAGPGGEFVLSCLLAEADLTMGLNGYASAAELTREVLVRVET